MTTFTEALARLPLYNVSSDNVPYTFNGRDGYGYVVELQRALGDIAVVGAFLAGLVDGAVLGVRWATQAIRVRSTANVSIANGLENGDALNGVTLATGNHVFLGFQTNPAENGIYTVAASGAAARASFANTADELAMLAFLIREGTAGTGERWLLSLEEADIIVGTTALNFSMVGIEPGYAAEVAAARLGEATLALGVAKAIAQATRERLAADRVYFVRTDGSDGNTGLADHAGGAFLTIQAAVNAAYALDTNGKTVVIQVRDGTYTTPVNLSGRLPGGGSLIIQGNAGAPQNVIVSTTNAGGFSALFGAALTVRDLEIRTTTAGNCLSSSAAAIIYFSNLRFGACATAHIYCLDGLVQAMGDWSIVGSAPYHIVLQTRGRAYLSFRSVTLIGTPAFAGAFVYATSQAELDAVSMVFSGAATGVRHYIGAQSLAVTGGSPTYFPGNAAGSVETANFALMI